jgi:hypothetical protein
MADSALAPIVPSRDLAFAIVSLYLGAAMLTHLAGDPAPAESLFRTGTNVGALLGALLRPEPRTDVPAPSTG